jgi:hypothetical protein
MRQAGQDSTDYLRKVLQDSVEASAEYRKAAADLVPNFAPELQKLATEYIKTGQRAAEAGRTEESRAANSLKMIREEIALRKQLNALAADTLKYTRARPTFDMALREASGANSAAAAERRSKDILAANQQIYRNRQMLRKKNASKRRHLTLFLRMSNSARRDASRLKKNQRVRPPSFELMKRSEGQRIA